MSDAFPIDLDAYLARVGYAGPREPTLEVLRGLVGRHARAIPFENLDILLGRGISVAPADVERKLVREGRGGYCFEQNTLLEQALLALGFEVTALGARVRRGVPRKEVTPRTHLFLLVRVDGEPWLADVGVGALTPTAPLRLVLDEPQPTPHETRRIVAVGDWDGLERRSPGARLYHQARLGDTWEDVCEFDLSPMPPIDRELANWYTSAHPASHFRAGIRVALATEDGRLSLMDRELKSRGPDGEAEVRVLEGPEEVLDVLAAEFGLRFPSGTRFEGLQRG